jgi:hypothetical protein
VGAGSLVRLRRRVKGCPVMMIMTYTVNCYKLR